MGTQDTSSAKVLPPVIFLSYRSKALRGLVGLLLIILIMRLWMGYYWQGQLDQRFAMLHAAGEATTYAELNLVPVPENLADDPRNVFVLAAAKMPRAADSPSNSNLMYSRTPPYDQLWWDLASKSHEANATAMQMIRKARLQSQQDKVTLRSFMPMSQASMVFGAFNNLSAARQLANQLCDSAVYLHLQGSSQESLEYLEDVQFLSQRVQLGNNPVSSLVSIGLDALEIEKLRIMAPGLHWEDPAVRNKATRLMQQMADDRSLDQSIKQVIRTLRLELKTISPSGDSGWLLRPLTLRQHAMDIEQISEFLRSFEDLSATAGATPSPQGAIMDLTSIADSLDWNTPMVTDSLRTQFILILSERHATAISLAANAYRSKKGQWPANLDVLCPDYLPAVPNDPLRKEQGPMQYHLIVQNGRQRPIIWLGDTPFNPATIPADEPVYYTAGSRGPFYRDLSQWKDPTVHLPVPPPETRPAEFQ